MRISMLLPLLLVVGGVAVSGPREGPPFVRFDLYEALTGDVVGSVKVVRHTADSIEVHAKMKDGVPGATYGVCIPVFDSDLSPMECAPMRVTADSGGKWTLDLTLQISPDPKVSYAIQLTASHPAHPVGTDVVVLPLAPR